LANFFFLSSCRRPLLHVPAYLPKTIVNFMN
jgi:hypothetical protein